MSYTVEEKKIIYADLTPQEGVILNLNTKYYYRLNETGQLVWQGITQGKSEEEIAQEFSQVYDVGPESAIADVKELVKQFEKEDLLQAANKEAPIFSVEKAHASKAGK